MRSSNGDFWTGFEMLTLSDDVPMSTVSASQISGQLNPLYLSAHMIVFVTSSI